MKTSKNEELNSLERKARSLWAKLTANDSLSVGEAEANYLMSGRVTELVDSEWVMSNDDKGDYAKIYGAVAADRQRERYAFIYVHFRYRIWKCNGLSGAYELIEKIREHKRIEKEIDRLHEEIETREKLLSDSAN